ncbi:MAG TPA: cytochrome c [Alphaproteobacteria bacterium]|nr:cytochrome c [Alphaproteobacteria bacterium]
MLSGAAFAQAPDANAVKRGEYLFNAGGCLGCHTDTKNQGAPLAGGRALATPFGTFYGPNITPDMQYGLGRWSEADFIRAMRHGVRPDGANLFPVFPYTSFTKISDADLKDLWAYLRTVTPVAQPNHEHDVGLPFNIRAGMTVWKWLNFTPGVFQPDPARPADVNRGAYIVQALAHCGECHTPRNAMGGLDTSRAYAGTPDGPEGERVPNITPHPENGIGKWSAGDVTDLLKQGMTPDGDFVGGSMGEVVRNTTGKLSDEDIRAVVAYLKTLPPIDNKVPRKTR